MSRKKRGSVLFLVAVVVGVAVMLACGIAFADGPEIQLGVGENGFTFKVATVLEIVFLLTVLSLVPSILVLLTSFTRVVIVFSLLRHAMGTQQVPPNMVVIGLALFLTVFIMMPVWHKVNGEAIQPYLEEQIGHEEALDKAIQPLRGFMAAQTREKDLALFLNLAKMKKPKNFSEVPTYLLIPAFVISEIKTAFQIGFLIYIPFLILDMVVASVLLAMGMMVLPPIIISLPFKMMLFVMVDGWYLVVESLVRGFRM